MLDARPGGCNRVDDEHVSFCSAFGVIRPLVEDLVVAFVCADGVNAQAPFVVNDLGTAMVDTTSGNSGFGGLARREKALFV